VLAAAASGGSGQGQGGHGQGGTATSRGRGLLLLLRAAAAWLLALHGAQRWLLRVFLQPAAWLVRLCRRHCRGRLLHLVLLQAVLELHLVLVELVGLGWGRGACACRAAAARGPAGAAAAPVAPEQRGGRAGRQTADRGVGAEAKTDGQGRRNERGIEVHRLRQQPLQEVV
jgi:hypothetical protein